LLKGGLGTACRFARADFPLNRGLVAEADGHPHGQDEPRIKRGRRHVIANLFLKPHREQPILTCNRANCLTYS